MENLPKKLFDFFYEVGTSSLGQLPIEAVKSIIKGSMEKVGQESVPLAMQWYRARFGLGAEDEHKYTLAAARMERDHPNEYDQLTARLMELNVPNDQALTDLRFNWFRLIILEDKIETMVETMLFLARMTDSQWQAYKTQMNLKRNAAESAYKKIVNTIQSERTRLGTELESSSLKSWAADFRQRMQNKNASSSW